LLNIAKCIDEYIRLRVAGKQDEIDARLESIVSRMFDRCFEDGQYQQALGIALESHRMDKVREAISSSNDEDAMLSYCFTLAQEVIHSRDFRQEVFRELATIYTAQSVPDYISICQCFLFLDDAKAIAKILESLLRKEESNDWLMAYQVAYELSENENLPFLIRVSNALPPAAKSSGSATESSPPTDEVCLNSI
jgi:26S proteasome regulatory subunit N2